MENVATEDHIKIIKLLIDKNASFDGVVYSFNIVTNGNLGEHKDSEIFEFIESLLQDDDFKVRYSNDVQPLTDMCYQRKLQLIAKETLNISINGEKNT